MPAELATFLAANPQVVEVRLAEVQGSAPRDASAVMYVAPRTAHGTVGGGEMEHRAIAAARAMLQGDGPDSQLLDLPLGPDLGQCCGGRVNLALRVLTKADHAAAVFERAKEKDAEPSVLIFGAGHVGRALAAALAPLPVRTNIFDQRAEELGRCTALVTQHLDALPEEQIRAAPPGSAFVVVTHDHGLDFLLTAEVLARGDAAYVGLIGSKTKRAAFRSWLAANHPGLTDQSLTCPIGIAGLGDKRPAVIAAHTAAEIMTALPTVAT